MNVCFIKSVSLYRNYWHTAGHLKWTGQYGVQVYSYIQFQTKMTSTLNWVKRITWAFIKYFLFLLLSKDTHFLVCIPYWYSISLVWQRSNIWHKHTYHFSKLNEIEYVEFLHSAGNVYLCVNNIFYSQFSSGSNTQFKKNITFASKFALNIWNGNKDMMKRTFW